MTPRRAERAGGGSSMSAVAAEFGQVVVEHMRSQPHRVYNDALAEYGNEWDADDAKSRAEEWLNRCEGDRDYALKEAAHIARNVDSRELGIVRSGEQIRRAVDTREIEATNWYDERGSSYTPKTAPARVRPVLGPPPWAGKGWAEWFREQADKAAKEPE